MRRRRRRSVAATNPSASERGYTRLSCLQPQLENATPLFDSLPERAFVLAQRGFEAAVGFSPRTAVARASRRGATLEKGPESRPPSSVAPRRRPFCPTIRVLKPTATFLRS